jgi:CHAT domain-containing protein
MSKTAIIEYHTTSDGTLIFVIKRGLAAPLVFESRSETGGLTENELLLCAERLIIDFQGLPEGWDDGPRTEHYKHVLTIPPAVNAGKRTKEVKQINLHKPAFAYELTYLERLSDRLLPAELKAEIDDCELLCIVPHGPLHSIPFAALRWSEDKYLIERFGLCYAHSTSVLRYCRSKNRQRAPNSDYRTESCLVAAVATTDDTDPREFEADGDVLATLFRELSNSAQVTRLIGANPSAGTVPASKELIREQAPRHDVIHLACHGMFGSHGGTSNPLDSRLLVSDGESALSLDQAQNPSPAQLTSHFLTAREIFSLELKADLVTLRACSSGRSEVRSGDELIGLTRAFLYAGTPSVLVSLWDVNKRSSQQLISEFYRLWLNAQSPLLKWQALRRAQLSLMRNDEYRHPYHWAPFVLVGDWQ